MKKSTKIEEVAPLSTKNASVELKKLAAGCKLNFTKFGIRKALTDDQKDAAAEVFDAQGSFISAARRLVDTKNESWKNVSRCFSQAKAYWKSVTLPYTEPGVRLIRQSFVTSFVDCMEDFQAELLEAVKGLNDALPDLKAQAKEKAGSLYNEADYPASFAGLFGIEFEFPAIDPPEYLKKLAPQVYEAECVRIAARFDQAVVMAEQLFTGELHKLTAHLTDVLTGGEDGKKKVFKDSCIENLQEFFERFKALSVRSSKDLDEVVENVKSLVVGVDPDSLRSNNDLKSELGKQMLAVSSKLETMLIERPRRKVVKGGPKKEDVA